MMFFRAQSRTSTLSTNAIRAASAAALLAYPAGALMVNYAGQSPFRAVAGYGLILAALVCVALLASSPLQRIVSERAGKLDEYELQLRNRAMNLAYAGFAALVLAGVAYAAVASDHGGWLPVTYEQFNGLFWGVFLYATVIPVAVLSWLVDDAF